MFKIRNRFNSKKIQIKYKQVKKSGKKTKEEKWEQRK